MVDGLKKVSDPISQEIPGALFAGLAVRPLMPLPASPPAPPPFLRLLPSPPPSAPASSSLFRWVPRIAPEAAARLAFFAAFLIPSNLLQGSQETGETQLKYQNVIRSLNPDEIIKLADLVSKSPWAEEKWQLAIEMGTRHFLEPLFDHFENESFFRSRLNAEEQSRLDERLASSATAQAQWELAVQTGDFELARMVIPEKKEPSLEELLWEAEQIRRLFEQIGVDVSMHNLLQRLAKYYGVDLKTVQSSRSQDAVGTPKASKGGDSGSSPASGKGKLSKKEELELEEIMKGWQDRAQDMGVLRAFLSQFRAALEVSEKIYTQFQQKPFSLIQLARVWDSAYSNFMVATVVLQDTLPENAFVQFTEKVKMWPEEYQRAFFEWVVQMSRIKQASADRIRSAVEQGTLYFRTLTRPVEEGVAWRHPSGTPQLVEKFLETFKPKQAGYVEATIDGVTFTVAKAAIEQIDAWTTWVSQGGMIGVKGQFRGRKVASNSVVIESFIPEVAMMGDSSLSYESNRTKPDETETPHQPAKPAIIRKLGTILFGEQKVVVLGPSEAHVYFPVHSHPENQPVGYPDRPSEGDLVFAQEGQIYFLFTAEGGLVAYQRRDGRDIREGYDEFPFRSLEEQSYFRKVSRNTAEGIQPAKDPEFQIVLGRGEERTGANSEVGQLLQSLAQRAKEAARQLLEGKPEFEYQTLFWDRVFQIAQIPADKRPETLRVLLGKDQEISARVEEFIASHPENSRGVFYKRVHLLLAHWELGKLVAFGDAVLKKDLEEAISDWLAKAEKAERGEISWNELRLESTSSFAHFTNVFGSIKMFYYGRRGQTIDAYVEGNCATIKIGDRENQTPLQLKTVPLKDLIREFREKSADKTPH